MKLQHIIPTSQFTRNATHTIYVRNRIFWKVFFEIAIKYYHNYFPKYVVYFLHVMGSISLKLWK